VSWDETFPVNETVTDGNPRRRDEREIQEEILAGVRMVVGILEKMLERMEK